jgi:AraC-like DNA-binding protein
MASSSSNRDLKKQVEFLNMLNEAEDWTWADLAEQLGVSVSTLSAFRSEPKEGKVSSAVEKMIQEEQAYKRLRLLDDKKTPMIVQFKIHMFDTAAHKIINELAEMGYVVSKHNDYGKLSKALKTAKKDGKIDKNTFECWELVSKRWNCSKHHEWGCKGLDYHGKPDLEACGKIDWEEAALAERAFARRRR